MHVGERFNTLSHFTGLLLALAGAVVLVVKAAASDDATKVVSLSIFAASTVMLYAASTLYHGARGTIKDAWACLDHCAIYLLIAGTYTPLGLITIGGKLGWCLAGGVWILALVGISRELWWGRHGRPLVALYVAMGWLGVVAASSLVRQLPGEGLAWLLAGAGLYSFGVIFYMKDGRWRHAHGVWHLFVLGGTTAHYITVLMFVA